MFSFFIASIAVLKLVVIHVSRCKLVELLFL